MWKTEVGTRLIKLNVKVFLRIYFYCDPFNHQKIVTVQVLFLLKNTLEL